MAALIAELDLFGAPAFPGFAATVAIVTESEEANLIAHIDSKALEPFRFQQWAGKRLTRFFGWSYDFETGRFAPAHPFPHGENR